jgi:putative ABC transport system permease protein
VRDTALNQESPQLYYPIAARVAGLNDVVVRTDGSPDALLPSVREKIRELDPQLALANIRTEDEWLSDSASEPRLNSVLLGVFASVALLIASIGIYGVLAFSVSQRTSEIGVRMALGATRSRVLGLIVTEGMMVALAGVGVGMVGALALGRVLASLVFGVQVHDRATFTFAGVTLTIVALAATLVPALRASRVDPMIALRHE